MRQAIPRSARYTMEQPYAIKAPCKATSYRSVGSSSTVQDKPSTAEDNKGAIEKQTAAHELKAGLLCDKVWQQQQPRWQRYTLHSPTLWRYAHERPPPKGTEARPSAKRLPNLYSKCKCCAAGCGATVAYVRRAYRMFCMYVGCSDAPDHHPRHSTFENSKSGPRGGILAYAN